MSQTVMYPGRINSLITRLQHNLTSAATTLDVTTISVLPAPPNLATIGYGEDAETILYTGISGFDLTGITRGFQGTAKAWPSQTVIGRMFTEYDHATFKANIEDLATSVNNIPITTGLSTFNSTTGREIVHNWNRTDYNVFVTPTANPAGLLGEVYVTIAANSFTIYNSGTATTAFKYTIILD